MRVNGEYSSTVPVLSGVPQGSVLGPALFLIFVADTSSIVRNFVSLYADDTKLFTYILDADTANDLHSTTSLQEDMNSLANFCDVMQMSYNIDKCHTLHLGSRNPKQQYTLPKMSNYRNDLNGCSYDYTFHNLLQVQEEKDLGITIDDQLSFRKHISNKVSKANSMIFLMKNTFKYLDTEMFKLLYKSLIRPHLEYGSPVWSPTLKIDINNIEKVQRRATRLVPELAGQTYEERLQHLQIPTLQYRRLRSDLILIFKITKQLLDLDCNTHCSLCRHGTLMLMPSLSKATRGHTHKYQLQHHQGIRNRFLTSRCINTWNSLNCKTVNATSVNAFKHLLANDLSMPAKFSLN